MKKKIELLGDLVNKLERGDEEILNLNDFLILPSSDIPDPVPILAVKQNGKEITIMTEDNVSMIFGPAKARKSALIRVIIQTVYVGETLKLKSSYDRKEIAIFDTEQSKFQCRNATRIIFSLTGCEVGYYSVVGLTIGQKKQLVETYLKLFPDCGLLILDNIVHFVNDFNSVSESNEITQWLLKLKSEYNTHILVVLHENPSGSGSGIRKPRGSLGTNLMNLCETAILIEKDPNDKTQSIVSANLTRGQPFEDLSLTMDYQMIPYLDDMPVTKQNYKR